MLQNSSQHRNSKTENKGKAKASQDKARSKTTPKKPKKITETYLHNSGLYYLQRFAASSGHFREVMLRKVKKSCMTHPDQNYDDCAVLVDTLVEKFVAAGLLDDETYTRSMVNSLRRRGKSARAIHAHLKSKKLDNDIITEMLEKLDNQNHENTADAEFEAALTFARKKRIGPFRTTQKDDDENNQKEMGRLARAGFSYDTARRVLETKQT